jgi:ABC-type amino acid transport substrate-binding protein
MAFAFSTPYLYTSPTIGGYQQYVDCMEQYLNNSASGLEINTNCIDLRVCVRQGTAIEGIVVEMLQPFGIPVTTTATSELFYSLYEDGSCNVLVGDEFQVSKNVTRRKSVDTNFESYVTTNIVSLSSRSPVAMVTRKIDITWSDFVNWVVIGLLFSELKNITRDRTLGNDGGNYYSEWNAFGNQYSSFLLNANKEVGHFGEIYDRNLEVLVSREAINSVNNGTEGGLITSIPFGKSSLGPEPAQHGTLQSIQSRNVLNCGVAIGTIFAKKRNSTPNDGIEETYSGFDVDYCRAITAAIFGDDGNQVNFIHLTTTERFQALQNGTVDVLSRITTVTLNRDVLERVTFSQPTFYDAILFGGKQE